MTREVSPAPTLEAVFKEHFSFVFRAVSRLLGPGGSVQDAEDITQQVFLAVQRALPKFRGDSKMTTWLYGIASRVVLNELRSRRRHRRLVDALATRAEVAPATTEAPDTQLARRQDLHRIWQALLTIKPKKRMVFVLYEIEGFSGAEVAQMLDIKEATVHTRLYHARRELDRQLEAMEDRP